MKPGEIFLIALVGLLGLTLFLPKALFGALFSGDPFAQEILRRYTGLRMWAFWYETVSSAQWNLGNVVFSVKAKFYAFQGLSALLPVTALITIATIFAKQQKSMMTAQTSAVWSKLADLKEYLGSDGVVLSKRLRTKLHTCFGHVLVIGPTGSGKTVSYFIPNIMLLPAGYSAVITDPKGELYQTTGGYHLKNGRRLALLKLDNKLVSECWNPLDFPEDAVMMSKICTSIVKNKGGDSGGGGGDQDFWDATAIDLLMALVYIVKALPPGTFGNFRNAYMILSACSFDAMIGLARYAVASTGMKEILSRADSFSDAVAPEETRNSTRFVLKTALSPFVIDDVACITAKTTIDFRDLKRQATLLYVSMPEHKVAGVKAVLSTLYMQIFDSLLDMGQGGREVFFFLDEFANIGKIIGFPQYIATIRSRNLSVSVCLQSGEQLTRNYSEPEKQEITNNLKTMVILPGLKEEKTLQYVQTVAGKISGYERSSAKEDKRTFTKDRLPMHEIRELEDNYDTGIHEAIIMLPNKPPIKDSQRRSYSDPEVKKLLDANPKIGFPTRDEAFFAAIREECFLEPGDIRLLELVGSFISYEGRIDKIPDDKKMAGLKKFEELSGICGLPNVSAKTGKLTLSWPEKKSLSDQGQIARHMIEKTFCWLHENGMLHVNER